MRNTSKGSFATAGNKASEIIFGVNIPHDISAKQVGRYFTPYSDGYPVHIQLLTLLMDHVFRQVLKVNPADYSVILSLPPFFPDKIAEALHQVMFGVFKVRGLFHHPSAFFVGFHQLFAKAGTLGTGIVVDLGESFTHVVPIIRSTPANYAIRRVSVGGATLTCLLGSQLAVRHFNMQDEPVLLTDIKEHVCYVSGDFQADMLHARAIAPSHTVTVQLPNYMTTRQPRFFRHGEAGPVDSAGQPATVTGQSFETAVERFSVPEALFAPQDHRIAQAGIAEAIIDAVSVCPEDLWPAMLSHIVLVGGTANLSGLQPRLEAEVRALAPYGLAINIRTISNPVMTCVEGMAEFAGSSDFVASVVTDEVFGQFGHGLAAKRFMLY